MGRKPAKMYKKVKGPAYTRKEFMTGVPKSRITMFEAGNPKANFSQTMSLVAEEPCQIRHSSIESARISANRYLEKKLSKSDYYFRVCVHPHHVLRENKQAIGAGADRVSDGMRKAFGKPVDTAARVSEGQKIFELKTQDHLVGDVKKALKKCKSKLPSPCKIVMS